MKFEVCYFFGVDEKYHQMNIPVQIYGKCPPPSLTLQEQDLGYTLTTTVNHYLATFLDSSERVQKYAGRIINTKCIVGGVNQCR